jgi:hypothetical protein
MVAFTIGARFKMSELGATRCPRLASKVGTVVGIKSRYGSVSVCFDGNKSGTLLHRDYIEVISISQAESERPTVTREVGSIINP